MRRMPFMMLALPALLLLWATPASAQQGGAAPEPSPPNAPQAEETRVTLLLEARLATPSDGIPVLPMNVLERLTDQEALVTLDMHAQGSSMTKVGARFLFPNMERFRTWYEQPATQALLRELDEASPSALSLALSVHRNR